MKKLFTACICAHLFFSPFALAKLTPLERLAEVSASQLELGLLKIDILATLMTRTYSGEKVPETRFQYKNFTYSMKPNKITLLVEYQGKSQYLTQNNCKALQEASHKIISKETLMSMFNQTSLTEDEKKEFHYLFEVRTRLVDKSNPALIFDCK